MRSLLRSGVLLSTILLVVPAPDAMAQSSLQQVDGLGDVILELPILDVSGGQRRLGQIFSGRVDATILDSNGNPTDFVNGDIIAFTLAPANVSGTPLIFTGTREAFDVWVNQNAQGILAILFPTSLAEGATGIDVAQSHSQSFLLSTALAAGGRGNIGGRLEYEQFDVDGASGNAVQGLFRFNAVAIETRAAFLNDALRTRSTHVGINAHPSYGHVGASTEWRVGGDGYVTALYSRSRSLDLGSFDFGGGPWASIRKDFIRWSVSGGGMLLGSKTYIPSAFISDDFKFVADVMNDRALRWDLTFGGATQYLLTQKVSIGTKVLHSRLLNSEVGAGRTSNLILVNLAYLVGGDSPVDFGYRFSAGGERYDAHAIFMNANFSF